MTQSLIVDVELKEADVKVEWYSGTGAGGQKRNKCQNSCRLTHLPTGATASSQTRSRENSFDLAWKALEQRVKAQAFSQAKAIAEDDRLLQTGLGNRGEKIRTYSLQHGTVKDHRTGKQAAVDLILKGGQFDKLA